MQCKFISLLKKKTLDSSGFLYFWWLVPGCSRILISIWAFLQLRAFRWWQNNLFARSLRSRSDFLTRARSCLLLDGWKLWVGTFMCPASISKLSEVKFPSGFLMTLSGNISWPYICPGSISQLCEVNFKHRVIFWSEVLSPGAFYEPSRLID